MQANSKRINRTGCVSMIIGYDFFSKDFHGNIFDTAIPTAELDEVTMGAGIYDELFVSVDTSIADDNVKPGKWKLKTIMDAKFQNDLEAGSLDADGHVVTNIQIYRRRYLEDKEWLIVGEFPYDRDYNVYSFVDRFTENGVDYEYAIVPVANKVIGDITVSEPVGVDYDGVYISDLENNFKLEVDFNLGDVSHNTNFATSQPLNGKYPILTYGTQNFQSGDITFLPLSEEQLSMGGGAINGREERVMRERVVTFLQKGGAKVIRNDNGQTIVVGTSNVKSTSKNGNLIDLSSITFTYTEIGKLDNETMGKAGLIGTASKSKYTFDENGEIVWKMAAFKAETGVKKLRNSRNSFAEEVAE